MNTQTLTQPDFSDLQLKAEEAAALLKLLANERRLLLLCLLASTREMTVGALADAVGISQSALSQHLALLREHGLVACRRDGQTMHYSIADPAAERFLTTLKDIYCGPPGPSNRKNLK
jgi:ArsR family transcriptional regulator, virulence genes transcriptional regulator